MTDATSDLTERYISAVTHRLPAGQRDDVGAELRTTIADMADGRMATTGPTGGTATVPESTIGQVLLELGNPAVLAGRYRGGTRQLIGPDLFYDFRRTVTTLLATLVPLALIVITTINIAIEHKPIGTGIGEAVIFTGEVAVQLAFWTIIAYALNERARSRTSRASAEQRWQLSQLPDLPSGRPIRLRGTIVSIAASVLVLVWLIAQQSLSTFRAPNGELLPVLNPAMWSFWLPTLMILLIAGIAVDVATLRAGRWTLPVMVINVILDAVSVGFFLIMIATQQVLDPRYLAAFAQASPDLDPSDGVRFVVLVVLLTGVLGIVKAIRGYRR